MTSSPGTRPIGKLTARTVAVSTLDQSVRDAAFALFQETYAGADRGRFDRDLDEKELIILLRDRRTKELKGFSTILVQEVASRDRALVIYSGDTVIHRDYWGQKQLQIAFARVLLTHKLRFPSSTIYWFLLSKGYRTYLLLANAFARAIPRYDTPDDPALRATLDALASSRFGAQYSARSGVVRYDVARECVRGGLVPITEELFRNPHVRFFVERNPLHERGEELACLAEVRWRDLIRIAARIALALAARALTSRRNVERGRPVSEWDARPVRGT